MGTRSLIHVKEDKKTITTIYRQYDGYPSGMGNDIKRILNNGNATILNGFGGGDQVPAQFNGLGCLASYLVGELKERKIGNVYLYPSNAKNVGEEFTYTITASKTGTLMMKVVDSWNKKVLFNDSLDLFDGEQVERKNNEEE